MLVVRVEEPMRVAPGGHVIDLELGETADGSLAQYLVATNCNVTVLSEPEAAGDENSDPDGGPEQDGGEGLSAALTATAGIVHEVQAEPEAGPDPEEEPAASVKPARSGKAAAK